VIAARMLYPRPRISDAIMTDLDAQGLASQVWIYLAGAALVGRRFADFPLMSFHGSNTGRSVIPPFPHPIAMRWPWAQPDSVMRLQTVDSKGILILSRHILTEFSVPMAFLGGMAAHY